MDSLAGRLGSLNKLLYALLGISVLFLITIYLDDYVQVSTLNRIDSLTYSDLHVIRNNSGDYSTIGNLTILDENSISITFNNERGYVIYRDGNKIWEIEENFEFEEVIRTGDAFIVHCRIAEGITGAQVMRLEKINMEGQNATLSHYNAKLPEGSKCRHPDIIENSLAANWHEIFEKNTMDN